MHINKMNWAEKIRVNKYISYKHIENYRKINYI